MPAERSGDVGPHHLRGIDDRIALAHGHEAELQRGLPESKFVIEWMTLKIMIGFRQAAPTARR